MQDLSELAAIYRFEVLVALFQFLEGFNDGLRHFFVGLLRSSHQREFLTRGDPFVSILVV